MPPIVATQGTVNDQLNGQRIKEGDVPTSGQFGRPAPVASIRDQIIEVARQELAARGLASMTIRQVARLTGVDPGTVRHYFHAKEDLVHAAVGVDAERVEAYRRTAADVSSQAAEGVGTALVAAAARYFCHDPAAEVAISVCVTGGDYESTVFGAFEREVVTPVARTLAADSGDELAALAMSAFLGLELLATLLPAAGHALCEADVQALLARSIDGYLEAG
jgi:AcrR family transcriptional regulator